MSRRNGPDPLHEGSLSAALAYLFDFGADKISDRDVRVTVLLHKFLALRSLTRARGTCKSKTDSYSPLSLSYPVQKSTIEPLRACNKRSNLPVTKVILGLPSFAFTSILSVYASVVILSIYSTLNLIISKQTFQKESYRSSFPTLFKTFNLPPSP